MKTLKQDIDDIIDNLISDDYSRKQFLADLSEGGCIAGMVPCLTGHSNQEQFLEWHKEEIEVIELFRPFNSAPLTAWQIFEIIAIGDKRT